MRLLHVLLLVPGELCLFLVVPGYSRLSVSVAVAVAVAVAVSMMPVATS